MSAVFGAVGAGAEDEGEADMVRGVVVESRREARSGRGVGGNVCVKGGSVGVKCDSICAVLLTNMHRGIGSVTLSRGRVVVESVRQSVVRSSGRRTGDFENRVAEATSRIRGAA